MSYLHFYYSSSLLLHLKYRSSGRTLATESKCCLFGSRSRTTYCYVLEIQRNSSYVRGL